MEKPTKYSEKIAEEICERIADGESLREICDEAGLPDRRTVRRWLREEETFRTRFAKARLDQADRYIDEMLDIAHDSRNDWIRRENARTGVVATALDSEAVMRSRLRIDTLKWIVERNAAKKTGTAGEGEGMDISVTIGGEMNREASAGTTS